MYCGREARQPVGKIIVGVVRHKVPSLDAAVKIAELCLVINSVARMPHMIDTAQPWTFMLEMTSQLPDVER
jgi:hypothetical protein